MLPDQREVHVWFVELAAAAASVEACSRNLCPKERERASRFRFEHLKAAFTLSRGILRVLLGRYLATEPDRVRFAYGPRGKPRLAFPETALEFNLAHSGRFAAYAFAVGCELGVDIEEVRQGGDQESFMRAEFFSREEREEWLGLDPSQRAEAFFRCWTRKEAYIKALGDGLSMPLDSFQVSLQAGSVRVTDSRCRRSHRGEQVVAIFPGAGRRLYRLAGRAGARSQRANSAPVDSGRRAGTGELPGTLPARGEGSHKTLRETARVKASELATRMSPPRRSIN